MTPRRRLPLASDAAPSLGLPTIMDRELAAAHGVEYVHLAVFSIDIDRVYWLEPELATLPFGWEVFLTERFLIGHIGVVTAARRDLLEVLCAPLLEETPGEPPLGGQIVFAIYDAVVRGALPVELTPMFASWRHPPRDLVASLADLHTDALRWQHTLAAHCLAVELVPPLAPPTRDVLTRMLNDKAPV
jgi:hypothetical protein